MKNYIGNNNEINKKKYKKSLPPKLNPDAGNVEYNIDMFNKASSGDANLSSAAGMNGMAESYNRDSLIARITEFGKHYNFDKYTDAQLNAILNRLVDASNHRKKILPKHQDRINIQSNSHIMNDDPSYNFEDPDREGEYRVENLREALNRLDHYCIDNDKIFYDLRSLYENIQHQLTAQEKQELKKLVDTTNDPDAIKAYIDSKDPDKKNEELDESISDWSDETDVNFDESLKESVDNLTYDELIDLAYKYYKQGGMEIIEFWDENSLKEYEKEFGPMTKKQAIRLMKVMGNVSKDEEEAGEYFSKETFEEGLNRKELETFSRAIFNAGDKNEALEIIDQIYQYDRNLSLQLKDMWDESASVAYNTDKLSGYLLRYNESLDEGVLDTLKAKRQARLDKIDAKKRSDDPLYDKMRSWEEKEQHKDDPIYDFVYDQKFKYSGSKYGVTQVPKNVVSAIIKNSAESISPDAFKDCTRLKDVKFENKIITIGKRAFMNCTSLTNMELPETVHTIEDEAFRGCSNLEHLTIPNQKVRIGQNVFEGCTKLVKNKNEELIQEDTVKQGSKWVNKGDSGKTHGKFDTKKQADAQRKAMFANGYKGESLKEDPDRQKISENSNRQDLKLTLNEDLFDDVVDIIVPDVETDFTVNTIDSAVTETPNLGNDTGVSNLIIKAINGEWDTIAEYNELIANLGNNSDMIPVIQDIVAEENTHIGQLQQILLQISPNVQNIEKGEIEGEEQLQEITE